MLTVAVIGAYAVPYTVRVRALGRRGRRTPAWRIACFAAGLVVLAIAVSPPIAAGADRHLSVHMVEHLLLGDLAPLLIVLGLTGPILAPLLRAPGIRRLRALSHPVAALAIWATSLYAWHLRFAYEAALANGLVHVLQHACFFAAGVNLWLALLGPLPKPAWFANGARLAYVLAMWITTTALANALIWSTVAFYPHYRAGAVADQSAAGAIMLVEGGAVVLALLGWLLARALRDAERRQKLHDLAARQGVVLAEPRVARAVAAERDDALARRLRER